jgi:hypothetical protein
MFLIIYKYWFLKSHHYFSDTLYLRHLEQHPRPLLAGKEKNEVVKVMKLLLSNTRCCRIISMA